MWVNIPLVKKLRKLRLTFCVVMFSSSPFCVLFPRLTCPITSVVPLFGLSVMCALMSSVPVCFPQSILMFISPNGA